MKSFLVVYRRSTGELLEFKEFEESERSAANALRREREGEFKADRDVEIVVLGADSREVVEQTHARYFKTPAQLLAD